MKKLRAFTLIELLVVIAIIAILAAILFPVFAQAKQSAKKISDLSNQKNVSLGMIMYTADYDDLLPMSQFYDIVGGTQTAHYSWHEVVFPYIKNGSKSTDESGGGRQAFRGIGGVFVGPGYPFQKQEGGSYVVNYDVFRDGWYDSHNPFSNPYNPRTFSPTSFDNIADKAMMFHRGADGVDAGGWNWYSFSSWEWDWVDWMGPDSNGNPTNPNPARVDLNWDCDTSNAGGPSWAGCGMHPRYRYNRVVNLALFDGHAKGFSRSQTNSQLTWWKNIRIPETDNESWSGWYPY